MPVSTKSVATISGIILSVGLATIVLLVRPPGTEGDVCSTKGCINAAARILNSMDTSADPCDDFYQYACGGWIDANPLPDDRSLLGVRHAIADANKETLRELLSSDDAGDRDVIRKIKTFFKSCMDEDAIENLGARPVLDFIDRIGGMPLLGDEFDEANFSLENAMAESPSAVITLIDVATDAENANRHAIALWQSSVLSMSVRDYYIDPRSNGTLLTYRRYMEDLLTTLWKSKDEIRGGKTTYNQTAVKSAADEIILFETGLAEILQPQSELRDFQSIYRKFTLEEMSKQISAEFDWYAYVNKLMGPVNYTVTSSTEVTLYGTKYLTKFMSVVKKFDNRVLKNYIVWMNLHRRATDMPKAFRKIAATYRKVAKGISKEEERWKMCVEQSKSNFKMPLGALFVKRFFSEGRKVKVKEMLNIIAEYFRQNVQKLTWMDNTTREKALLKIDSFDALLAYPDYIIDEEDPRLDKEFEDLNIPDNDYYTSKINIVDFNRIKRWRKIAEAVDRFDWDPVQLGPATVNAMYDDSKNLMILPAGYIQEPYFDENQPHAVNYGGIGSSMGHTAASSLDVRGSRFNDRGEIENWWSNFSKKHFEEKAQCVRDQYSGFYYDLAEMFVNGNLTIYGNIGDLAGVRLAYGAYQSWRKNSGKTDFKLPGLEHFSQEQLFFISFGQVWCASETKEEAQYAIQADIHSPWMFRVNGAVMNFRKFGKAFGCKKGVDKLFPLPENTCRVW